MIELWIDESLTLTIHFLKPATVC